MQFVGFIIDLKFTMVSKLKTNKLKLKEIRRMCAISFFYVISISKVNIEENEIVLSCAFYSFVVWSVGVVRVR